MKTAPIPMHFFILNDLKIVTERMQNTLLIFREIVKESMQMAHQQTGGPRISLLLKQLKIYTMYIILLFRCK